MRPRHSFSGSAGVAVLMLTACGPSASEKRQVERWLLCDECVAGERDSVVALGNRVLGLLDRGLRGPDSTRYRNVRRQFQASYARVETAAAQAGTTPSLSQADYLEHYL